MECKLISITSIQNNQFLIKLHTNIKYNEYILNYINKDEKIDKNSLITLS